MFAFCLWDRQKRTAVMARDPCGIKPLYLWQGSGGEFLFASELRPLPASDLAERCLSGNSLTASPRAGSVPELPSLAAGVPSRLPGHAGKWSQGALTLERLCNPPFTSAELISPQEVTAHCRQALERTVQAHRLSDVPEGLFLLGGLDSAVILVLAPRCFKTFTIDFPQASHDDSARAAELAR